MRDEVEELSEQERKERALVLVPGSMVKIESGTYCTKDGRHWISRLLCYVNRVARPDLLTKLPTGAWLVYWGSNGDAETGLEAGPIEFLQASRTKLGACQIAAAYRARDVIGENAFEDEIQRWSCLPRAT